MNLIVKNEDRAVLGILFVCKFVLLKSYRNSHFMIDTIKTVGIYFFISTLLIGCYESFGGLKPGYDTKEAKDLSAICAGYTFYDLYGSDSAMIPSGYEKRYTSKVIGLDNQFQIFKNQDGIGVIHFRGSTSEISSWVENMYSAMIPATGVIKVNGVEHAYSFANDPGASVHSGYALAIVLMSDELMQQIDLLKTDGVTELLICGHSQGGALTNLAKAYLENMSRYKLLVDMKFKAYAFANPMCGNDKFAAEFIDRFGGQGWSFSTVNPADMVIHMPVHYQETNPFSLNSFKEALYSGQPLNFRKMGMDLLIQKFEPTVTSYIQTSNKIIDKFVYTTHNMVKMPEYTEDINYFELETVISLPPFEYPKVKLDTAGMSPLELAANPVDDDGNYYRKEPAFFQHKPYNYYVAILKKYYRDEYEALDVKYLPENL